MRHGDDEIVQGKMNSEPVRPRAGYPGKGKPTIDKR